MRLGEPLTVQDQAHHDLLAVGPVIARVAPPGLRIVRALALEVRRRQVVEIDRVVQVEQRALAGRQGLLDCRPLRVQPIEVAIQRLVAERADVDAEEVGQSRAPDPLRHGVLGRRTHQAVERHQLGEHPRPGREPRRGQDRVQRERPPRLMADVDGPRFADVFDPDLVGVDCHQVLCCGRQGARATPSGTRSGGERVDGGIGHERCLAAQRGREFLREALPLPDRRGRQRTERTDRAVARAVRGGDRLDEKMIDVRLGADSPGRALNEHADPISLLRPLSCQGKSPKKLVTILQLLRLTLRHFSHSRGACPRKSPFACRGPWKLG